MQRPDLNWPDLDHLREQEKVEHARHEHDADLKETAACACLLASETRLNEELQARLAQSRRAWTRAWYLWRLMRSDARIIRLRLRSG